MTPGLQGAMTSHSPHRCGAMTISGFCQNSCISSSLTLPAPSLQHSLFLHMLARRVTLFHFLLRTDILLRKHPNSNGCWGEYRRYTSILFQSLINLSVVFLAKIPPCFWSSEIGRRPKFFGSQNVLKRSKMRSKP